MMLVQTANGDKSEKSVATELQRFELYVQL